MSDQPNQTSHPVTGALTVPTAKVETLIEALPWMQRYHNEIMVVKFGGNAMVDPELITAFAEDIAFLRHAGMRPVVVHGGGPHISRMLERVGIESDFRAGYRYTSAEAIEIVRMGLGCLLYTSDAADE